MRYLRQLSLAALLLYCPNALPAHAPGYAPPPPPANDDCANAAHAELLVPVVPSHALREVLASARPHLRAPWICTATKGIEDETLETIGFAEQVREIATTKLPDLNANDVEAAMKIVEGTARSMGVTTPND